MKDFEEFKSYLDADQVTDAAIENADKNDTEGGSALWQRDYYLGAMFDMLRQYHEWLNKAD